jgi:[acyl-carrier-protein] S-malonyltransferase
MLPATIAFVYPAQGSLRPGLGRLWRDDPAWRYAAHAAVTSGVDLERLLLSADARELGVPRHAELCTYVLSIMALDAMHRAGVDAALHAGHSVGQFSALTAAGALDFRDGVILVCERAEAIAEAAVHQRGGMTMVSGVADHHIDELCASIDEVWVASYNTPGHTVIAGSQGALADAERKVRHLGARAVVAVRTDAALQTPYMLHAAARFGDVLDRTRLDPLRRPVFANVDGRSYFDRSRWLHLLRDQLTCPIQWRETVRQLERAGASLIVELGPTPHLTRFARRAARSIPSRHVSTPDEAAQLAVWGGRDQIGSPTDDALAAEHLVVSPAGGLFAPAEQLVPGALLAAGMTIGTVGTTPVTTRRAGRVHLVLARPGERLRAYEPVAWLHVEPSV